MNQVKLEIEPRSDTGKGAAGRLRKTGRVPGVMYGYEVDPTAVSIDALDLYHVLHTRAGSNVLLTVALDGDDKLCVARDIQRHPVRGNVTHIDLLSVDKNAQITVDIPVSIEGAVEGAGVVNQVLGAVPINVAPLETPNSFTLNVDGLEIGDTLRVEELADQLPEGATFDVDPDRTVVTVNPPEILEVDTDDEDTALDEFAGEGLDPADLPEGVDSVEDLDADQLAELQGDAPADASEAEAIDEA